MTNKLRVLLLSVLSSTNEEETNCRIANYILENGNDVAYMNIVDLAKACYVSNSSISRFCKDIGLDGLSELKKLLKSSFKEYQVIGDNSDPCEGTLAYIDGIQEGIQATRDSLDMDVINRIVDDLVNYQRVATFGLLNAETVALGLQNDMVKLGKKVVTKVSLPQQKEYLEHTNEEDLVIIFSSSGKYFTSKFNKVKFDSSKPKIILITSNKQVKKDDIFDEVLVYPRAKFEALSPFQQQLIKGILVQNYAMRIKNR